jgi:hypothetical protein
MTAPAEVSEAARVDRETAAGGSVFDYLTGDPDFDRDIIRGAMLIWAGRQIKDELPPSIDTKALEAVRKAKLCAWCLDKLGAQRSEFNGGIGHPECARYAYECIAGDDPMPWPMPHDPLIPFCEHLGREAAALGLDMQKLARAIERARRA